MKIIHILFSLAGILLVEAVAEPDLAFDSTHSHRMSLREWKRCGCPIPKHPISHTKDGEMIIGTANAEGTK